MPGKLKEYRKQKLKQQKQLVYLRFIYYVHSKPVFKADHNFLRVCVYIYMYVCV